MRKHISKLCLSVPFVFVNNNGDTVRSFFVSVIYFKVNKNVSYIKLWLTQNIQILQCLFKVYICIDKTLCTKRFNKSTY